MLNAQILGALATGAALFAVSVPAQDRATSGLLRLRFATFDPVAAMPAVPADLRSDAMGRLFIVQFVGVPTAASRALLVESMAEVHGYLPDNAYVVRMAPAQRANVAALPGVRWVGAYHPAYRIDPALVARLRDGDLETRRYNLVVVDKHTDKPALGVNIRALGGEVAHAHEGSLLFSATLTPAQLVQVAGLDEVLWIDAWGPAEVDMDNARIQGGADYVENQTGYTGAGVNAHVYEGIEASHPDFTGSVTNVLSSGAATTHGHATAGIVFGNGTSNPAVRGMAPDCGKFYTNFSTAVSRYQVVSDLVNVHAVSHTTASWGGPRTPFYTSTSADADDIIFDHDIAWTQSQSNSGNQDSRPEAWAKNIFSIGGVDHGDNANPLDDSWALGGGSTGPAVDFRIKPTLSAYYDDIGTSDLTGSAGYSSGNWTAGFGGTSGSTPIVAGHNVLAIQMFTDDTGTPGIGRFGNPLRNPGGSVHDNRPHFTALKCLQVVSARQYAFTATSTDNRREHVGWGFPDLQSMWDDRGKTYIVDETDVLAPGTASRFDVVVAAGEPSLRIAMHYAEPAANPAAAKTLINDLDLRVVGPNGTVYWGNAGLEQGNWSTVGGNPDDTNPIECVFVQNPMSGQWRVDIVARAVVADNHIETAALDADYGLVIVGGQTTPGTAPALAEFEIYGQGCAGSVQVPNYCAQVNGSGGVLTGSTSQWEYAYEVSGVGSAQVLSFDIFTASIAGPIMRQARLYAQGFNGPASTPLATTNITIGTTPGFYTATFAAPVAVSGTFYIGYDNAPNGVVSNLTGGITGRGFFRSPTTGAWTQSGLVQFPSWRVTCTGGPLFVPPVLGNVGLPILGGSYDITLADAAATAPAFLLVGLSDQSFQGTALPAPIPGAPGCDIQASPHTTQLVFTSAAGTASTSLGVPNTLSFVGIELFHQWAVLDAVNAIGIVVSDAGKATVGG